MNVILKLLHAKGKYDSLLFLSIIFGLCWVAAFSRNCAHCAAPALAAAVASTKAGEVAMKIPIDTRAHRPDGLRMTPVNRLTMYHSPPSDLTVHVYDLPDEYEEDMLKRHADCQRHQWAFEVRIPKVLRKQFSAWVNPATADFYLVPFPVKCYNNFEADYDPEVVNRKYITLLTWLRTEHPWFDRSGGMDHIFIFPSGQGSQIFPSSAAYLKHSIFLVAEGDRTKNHTNPFKDIVVPGFSTVKPIPQSAAERSILAAFRGSTRMSIALRDGTKIKKDNDLRLSLEKELLSQEDVIFSGAKVLSNEYVGELSRSKFIICPRGITPWTRRVFDGLFAGAVPVVISDDIEFPFEADIDWSLFTIKISEKDAIKPNFLVNRLRALVDNGTYQRKLELLYQFRDNFDWDRSEVLNGILWQLHRRRRMFKHGSLRVWDS